MPHGRRRQRLAAVLQGLMPGPELPGLADALALRADLEAGPRLHPERGESLPVLLISVRGAGLVPPLRLSQLRRAGLAAATPPRWYRCAVDSLALLVGLDSWEAAEPAACRRQLQALQAALRRGAAAGAAAEVPAEALLLAAQLLRPGEEAGLRMRLQALAESVAERDPAAIHLLSPADRQGLEQQDRLDLLLRSLGPDDLELCFQPILLVNAPGRIALEMLLRFRPPELALLGTQAVLQRAHDLDLAHRIDRLVIARLAGVRRDWCALGPLAPRVDSISVNLSVASVATVHRQEALVALLRAERVDPGLFRLELTETAALERQGDDASVRSAAERLMEELNFRLLVDDFGSGLSNYRRLCEATYDAIKLDLQLVRGIAASFRLQRFVGSLIEAVHGFGRTVVAEGVEHHRDLAVLLRLGADAVQGYLIARPMPWSGIVPFLQESPWTQPGCLPALQAEIAEADRQLQTPLAPPGAAARLLQTVPLERHVLEHWSSLRSFEEVVLLFVQELRGWGLELMRLSLAFLPDREEVDCSQYIWYARCPGEVQSLRMQRDFLQTTQHRESALHHIATRCSPYRVRLADGDPTGFGFLEELRRDGGTDYLGLRLAARGVSVPVVTICLSGPRAFTAQEVERIETMSSLLSLLFHAFECERASRLALLDPLTQLPNRRSFDSRIRAEAVAAATGGMPLALLLIDIDRFKLINDSLGHAHGDTCLSRVGAVLREQLQRQNDMVARLGGEEFGVVLAHTDQEQAGRIAERLRRAVAEIAIPHPEPINGRGLTVSLGLASWSPGAADPDVDRLLQLADDCLYRAKRQGRDRVVGAAMPAGQD